MRAVSIQTGYLIEGTGAKSCTITYLAQVDPKGERGTPQLCALGPSTLKSFPHVSVCLGGPVGSLWNSGGLSGGLMGSQCRLNGSSGWPLLGLNGGFGLSEGSGVACGAQWGLGEG